MDNFIECRRIDHHWQRACAEDLQKGFVTPSESVRPFGYTLTGDVKTGLNTVLIDSYERSSQNWTQGFEKESQKRCGYDLTRFLPVFSGRVVDSPKATDRFLWDCRRTVADMFAENYSGKFAEMAHHAGLKYSVEPYNCPSDDLQYGSYADVPLCLAAADFSLFLFSVNGYKICY